MDRTILCALGLLGIVACRSGEGAPLARGGTIDDRDHPSVVAALRAMTAAPVAAHVRMTESRVANGADSLRADALVVAMREALGKYTDVHVAERDGFRSVGDSGSAGIVHYVNFVYALEEALRFNPAKPSGLVYRRSDDGALALIGALFTAPENASLHARVPLGVARWHRHVDWCTPKTGDEARWSETATDGTPVFGPASHIFVRGSCDSVAGVFHPREFGWMVYANIFISDNPDSIWSGRPVLTDGHHSGAPPTGTPDAAAAAAPSPAVAPISAPRPAAPVTMSTKGSLTSGGASVSWERFATEGMKGRHPALILLHGAEPSTTDDATLKDAAERLAKRGYVVEVLQYFDRTGTTKADMREDFRNAGPWIGTIGDAITQIASSAEVDSAKIGLIGVNLGASLALHRAQNDPRVKAVVDYFGNYRVRDEANAAKLPPVLVVDAQGEAQRMDVLLTKYQVRHELEVTAPADSRQAAAHAVAFLEHYLPTSMSKDNR